MCSQDHLAFPFVYPLHLVGVPSPIAGFLDTATCCFVPANFKSKGNEVASIGSEEFRVGTFFAEAGIVERSPLKAAVPAA